MPDVVELGHESSFYEADEHAWIERQVAALRGRDFDQLDHVNLIEFLTAMALRDLRELESRLELLYAHILKFAIQPGKATRSWQVTIGAQQRAIDRLLKRLPSLRARGDDVLRDVYPDAVKAAVLETGQQGGADGKPIPSEPVLTIEEVLSFQVNMSPDGTGVALSHWPL